MRACPIWVPVKSSISRFTSEKSSKNHLDKPSVLVITKNTHTKNNHVSFAEKASHDLRKRGHHIVFRSMRSC